MNFVQFLGWLQESHPIAQLRAANHLVIEVTEVLHVVGLVTLLSALLLVNLRLLGIGLRRQTPSLVAGAAAPLVGGGLAVTLATGAILFLSGPVRYYYNTAFLPKMALLFLALLVQFTLYRKVTRQAEPSPVLAGGSALVSLTLWFGVGLCGRAIGYV